jgi:hypothetical protein
MLECVFSVKTCKNVGEIIIQHQILFCGKWLQKVSTEVLIVWTDYNARLWHRFLCPLAQGGKLKIKSSWPIKTTCPVSNADLFTTTLFYSKLRPTFEPDYSTLEQTSFFSKFACTERDIPWLITPRDIIFNPLDISSRT